jgi:hypothetical protein
METSALYTEPSAAIHKKKKSSWRMKTLIFPDYLREDIHFFHQKNVWSIHGNTENRFIHISFFRLLPYLSHVFPHKVWGAGSARPVFVAKFVVEMYLPDSKVRNSGLGSPLLGILFHVCGQVCG